MKKVCVVVGTRPEAIKLAPVILQLKKFDVEVVVVTTGQHKDMVAGILDFFGIHDRVGLNISRQSGTLSELTSLLLTSLDEFFTTIKPNHVVVQGDTTTAFVGALVAFYHKIPVSHVEAGLRTFDKFSPWPEEINRSFITSIADLHFAPTQLASDNLRSLGVSDKQIFVSGNTVIDALLLASEIVGCDDPGECTDVLVTCHRRENLGKNMASIFQAIAILAEKYPHLRFIFPMHPNQEIRILAQEVFGAGYKNVILREPAEYPEFVTLMKRSVLILTDSGGVKEEAPSLGRPVLVLRDTTERPEGVIVGTAQLVGTTTNGIIEAFSALINDKEKYARMASTKNPYGDGTASVQIADVIISTL